jgi:hypothetical protein
MRNEGHVAGRKRCLHLPAASLKSWPRWASSSRSPHSGQVTHNSAIASPRPTRVRTDSHPPHFVLVLALKSWMHRTLARNSVPVGHARQGNRTRIASASSCTVAMGGRSWPARCRRRFAVPGWDRRGDKKRHSLSCPSSPPGYFDTSISGWWRHASLRQYPIRLRTPYSYIGQRHRRAGWILTFR